MSKVSWKFSQDPSLRGATVKLVEAASQPVYQAAVVGAGPAGLFAARQLAAEGVTVALFNRDIKPGGLAEYGIYPDKLRMKEGLRQQFRQVLDQPDIHYFGNLVVAEDGDLRLPDLIQLGFQAVLVTVGAQGTKWLGLPGENLKGVYHAKDIVYHYNRLPPYATQPFHIGRRVAVIGAGNVSLDITRWLVEQQHVESVTAVIRRGPAEVKFTRAELETVVANLDLDAFSAELERIAAPLQAVGEDPGHARALIDAALERAQPATSPTCFRMMFLVSPVRVLGDRDGKVCGLVVQNNLLQKTGDTVRAVGTGTSQTLDVDTVIFAIGDRVDEHVGLPVEHNEYVKNPQPRFPIGGESYEVYDPRTGQPLEGVFVAGWSRQASTGLVGIARKDGINGANAVLQYLRQRGQPGDSQAIARLEARLAGLPHPVVGEDQLRRLEAIEAERAAAENLPLFKFSSNEEMLGALGLLPSPKE